MRILLTVALLLSAAVTAAAQEGLEELKYQDRVIVRLKNKNTLKLAMARYTHVSSLDVRLQVMTLPLSVTLLESISVTRAMTAWPTG